MASKRRRSWDWPAPVRRARGLIATGGLLSLTLAMACGNGVPSPTSPGELPSATDAAPKPPPPPSAPGPLAGTITMVSSSPAYGTSLAVRDCRFGSVTRRCADGWQGIFEVSLDRDMERPVLTVSFYDGAVLCGYAADTRQRLTAREVATFSPTWISLSDEFGTFSPPCQLPSTTARMVAVLWTDSVETAAVSREFAGHYTFVQP